MLAFVSGKSEEIDALTAMDDPPAAFAPGPVGLFSGAACFATGARSENGFPNPSEVEPALARHCCPDALSGRLAAPGTIAIESVVGVNSASDNSAIWLNAADAEFASLAVSFAPGAAEIWALCGAGPEVANAISNIRGHAAAAASGASLVASCDAAICGASVRAAEAVNGEPVLDAAASAFVAFSVPEPLDATSPEAAKSAVAAAGFNGGALAGPACAIPVVDANAAEKFIAAGGAGTAGGI